MAIMNKASTKKKKRERKNCLIRLLMSFLILCTRKLRPLECSSFQLLRNTNPNINCLADSIVIGFWVGLAVFVIFMFFVLTLLTKTGAPHQE